MPIALRPGAHVDVVLAIDRDLPPETRPTFHARAFSGHEHFELLERLQEVRGFTGLEQSRWIFSRLDELIVGWRNLTDRDGEPIPSGSVPVSHVLSVAESWELLAGVMECNSISPEQRGNSASPSSSPAADSAAGVVEGDASTPRLTLSPPASSAPSAMGWETGVSLAAAPGRSRSPDVLGSVPGPACCGSSNSPA